MRFGPASLHERFDASSIALVECYKITNTCSHIIAYTLHLARNRHILPAVLLTNYPTFCQQFAAIQRTGWQGLTAKKRKHKKNPRASSTSDFLLTKGGVICQQHEGGPGSRSARSRLGKRRGRWSSDMEQTSVPCSMRITWRGASASKQRAKCHALDKSIRQQAKDGPIQAESRGEPLPAGAPWIDERRQGFPALIKTTHFSVGLP